MNIDNNKKVSVIIPTYNSSKTINSCLTSVIEQQGDFFCEIIVIDDVSDDKYELKINIDAIQYNSDKFEIKTKFLSYKAGGGGARNEGIRLATGDYICFLDSDDYWLAGKIESQLELYKEKTVLTSSVIKGKTIDEGVILPEKVKAPDEDISDALFVNGKLIQTSTFFMSRYVAESVMFNGHLPRHQDYDFLLKAQSKGFIIIQNNKPTSFWRVEDFSGKRFVSKKIKPYFFIEWFLEYREFMTKDAQFSYVAKNIFSACIITREIKMFFKFLFSNVFSFLDIIIILKQIFIWRIKRFIK